MAYDAVTKRKVRSAYVFDCLELKSAAEISGVPYSTAKRWKQDAKASGDDWDKSRDAQVLAGGAVDDVARQCTMLMIRNVQAVMAQIETDKDMTAETKIKLLSTGSDAFSKNAAALRRFAPETDALAIQLQLLKSLGDFIYKHFPQHASAFSEILPSFGDELAA